MSKSKRNAGWFKEGYDPRRKKLGRREARKGYRVAVERASDSWELLAWLTEKVKRSYRGKR